MRVRVIPRAVVDSADLQRVMTAALQSMNDDYKDREFGNITKRRKLDKHGCNWRAPVVLCSDIREDDNNAAAATVIKNFQAEYNIE